MLVSPLNKKGQIRKPYIAVKNKNHSSESVEGRWELWFYFDEIVLNNVKSFKYYCLRYAGTPARFKTRKDAIDYAHYRLGM